MTEPGAIEIDRGGSEPLIRITQPQETFTVQQLRLYAEHLATLADETAEQEREPEVEALVGVFESTVAPVPDV